MIRLYRHSIRALISTQRFSTVTQEFAENEPETNFVKLIGTVSEDSTRLPSGALTCKILQSTRTPNGAPFTCSHILTIKSKVQKTSGIKSLAKGQRINVNGYIRSIKFQISGDKTRSAIAIIPYDIQTMHAGDSLPDICFVIMTAHIESRIWDDGKHMSFSLRTHIPFRNDADGFTGETTKHSHSIIVADSKLQQHVRKHITQYDQIFLEGHLNYKSVQLENGMKRICGNIIPVHIEKI